MRALHRLPAAPGRPITAAFSSHHPYSAGRGRGIGRGGAISPPNPSPPGHVQPDSIPAEEDPFTSFIPNSIPPPLPSSPALPSFSSIISTLKPSSSLGRGRGSQPKEPIFFRRADPGESGSGRGKPTRIGEPDARPVEENRHVQVRVPGSDEAARRAVDILSRGGRGGVGRGRGSGRGRGRGRGERFGGRRGRRDGDQEFDLYLGDNADGEKLEKRIGEENARILAEGFEEMSWRVLPSPTEEAYLDALHTNNLIEYEPEYLVEFDRNPDIDEKPPMPLEEVLATAKPFLMAYTGMKSQEEWEEAVKDLMERLPHMKELVDMYSGPNRVTAKQQQEELERVANTLPEKVPSSVRRFADRAVLSLQSNPGWGFDKKCQFMDKLVRDVSQHYN